MKNRFNIFIALHRLMPDFIRPLIPVPKEIFFKDDVLERTDTGMLGEDLAQFFLSLNGYSTLERNYKCRLGEIDLIARDGNEVVFVEVKARTNVAFGRPEEAVNGKKQTHISRVALYYLKKKGLFNHSARFDVLSVLIDKKNKKVIFNQVKDAFELNSFYLY